MTKREHKYHYEKKLRKSIIDILAKNISDTIDAEILKTLIKIAKGEVDNVNDLIPFNTK